MQNFLKKSSDCTNLAEIKASNLHAMSPKMSGKLKNRKRCVQESDGDLLKIKCARFEALFELSLQVDQSGKRF